MAKARIEVDRAEQVVYIDFGVESRGVGSAVEISPTVSVDLDVSGVAVGVELLSFEPAAVSVDELCERGRFRAEDARLIERHLPAVLRFLAGDGVESPHPAAEDVDCFYVVH